MIDPAPYEAVSGGFTWDNKVPTATTFAADGSSSITLNFTENEVIATLYYYVDRGDGKLVRFAPLGVGTANTFIYKGYANTKMPTDPAKFAQLYPQVSGYELTDAYTHVANQDDIITDVMLLDGTDKLAKGLASTETLGADSTKNNVFVLYCALPQTATIRYVDRDGNLITNFVDANGRTITMPTTVTGVTGQDYGLGKLDDGTILNGGNASLTGDAKNPKITLGLAGYNNQVVTDTAQAAGKVHDDTLGYDVPQSVLVNNAGTFGASNSSIITVTYTADTQTANVVFKDQNGNDVLGKTATTVSGYSNTALASKITPDMTKAPAGYTFVSVSGANTGDGYAAVDTNFDNDKSVDQTVTVIFKAIQQTARVHYVDENGQEINGLPITTLTGAMGSKYSVAAMYKSNLYNYVNDTAGKMVPGYTLQKDQMKDGLGADANLITSDSVFNGSSNDLYILYAADSATLIVRYYVLDPENPDN